MVPSLPSVIPSRPPSANTRSPLFVKFNALGMLDSLGTLSDDGPSQRYRTARPSAKLWAPADTFMAPLSRRIVARSSRCAGSNRSSSESTSVPHRLFCPAATVLHGGRGAGERRKAYQNSKKSPMLGIPTASQAMPAALRLSLLPALPLQDQSCQCSRALRGSMGSRFSVGGTCLVKHRHTSDVHRSTPGVLAPAQVTFQARRTAAVVLAREILFGLPMVAWDYLIKGRLHVRPALLSSIARAYRNDCPRGTLDQDASIPLPGSSERESC